MNIDKQIQQAIRLHVLEYHARNGRFVPPTAEDCQLYANEIKYEDFDVEYFMDYHIARNWCLKGGQKMRDYKATIRTWKKNEAKRQSKTRLLPIPGRHCSKCQMPAVYKSGGNFDFYYCAEHMPDKVKEKYYG